MVITQGSSKSIHRYKSTLFSYRIGDVMVSVPISSAVDRGFEPMLSKTKDYKTGICCFSAKHAA